MNVLESPLLPFVIIGAIALPIYIVRIVVAEVAYRRLKKQNDKWLGKL